ncbi:MAG TPA: DUF5312 family protein, partial [Rectinemataceae bacterium]|nr:DUF5312 family protein [Rectinemataceae bacterium]
MPERSIFDTLVSELSAKERRDLLDQLARRSPVSKEPLFVDGSIPGGEAQNYTERLESLGLLARFVLFLRGLFTGKSPEALLRADDLREIARRVEPRFPGLVDTRHGYLLKGFADELKRLRDSARFFYDALDRSVEKDKSSFYAFLASMQIPEVHARLLEKTEPARIEALRPSVTDSEMRSLCLDGFDEAFGELPEDGRRAMYHDVRSLLFLKRLSGFLFERLLGCFRTGGSSLSVESAAVDEARDYLFDLGDILFSMASPPSASLMSALFLFVERDELAKPETDAARILGSDLEKAESALGKIRDFFNRIPFADILRLVSGDPAYSPRELAGGEDWLATYKGFWRERVERQLEQWLIDRRMRELAAEVEAFLGKPGPVVLPHISREGRADSPPVRQQQALSFLDGFFRGPFLRDLIRPLKILLVDGDFYRKDNQIEFTDAYDILFHLTETIATFDSKLMPEGELGSAWSLVSAEIAPLKMKQRRTQNLVQTVNDEAERIIRRAGRALRTMVEVIRGILKGEAGGKYDSLVNLSYLDGRGNKEFLRSLEKAKDKCERAYGLLSQLSGLDLSQD